jgi:hypothetical protein
MVILMVEGEAQESREAMRWTGAGIVRRRDFQWRWRRDWDRGGTLHDHGIGERRGWLDHTEPHYEAYFGCAVRSTD